jgi:hypothetical protein
VDAACNNGKQKVRVYVSDPIKTIKLRAKGGTSLEEFNRKYTLLFAGYANNKQPLSSANADNAIKDAKKVLANSPESCSDWIPDSWNSNQSCQAFIYTDLGFISRVRPTPNFKDSEFYYKKALEISPGMCGATSYLAELRVQEGVEAIADLEYAKACVACGKHTMDLSDLELAYAKRGWTPPPCPAAGLQQHSINWNAGFTDSAARAKKAKIGDLLTFSWSGMHDVYVLSSKGAFDSCDLTNATKIGAASPTKYTISSLPVYFACQVGAHCKAGQKLAVTQQASGGGNKYFSYSKTRLRKAVSGSASVTGYLLSSTLSMLTTLWLCCSF